MISNSNSEGTNISFNNMKSRDASCGIHSGCERIVPTWLVLLDNIPTMGLFLLGAGLVGLVWWPLGILMLLYNVSTIVLFWWMICRHCPHFATRACPCGYGVIAARYFHKKEGSDFRKVFRKNIVMMLPCWFIPLGAGIYMLCAGFSRDVLIIVAAFVAVGFVLIPAISRFVGCKGCDLKQQCPWMTSIKEGRL